MSLLIISIGQNTTGFLCILYILMGKNPLEIRGLGMFIFLH